MKITIFYLNGDSITFSEKIDGAHVVIVENNWLIVKLPTREVHIPVSNIKLIEKENGNS